MRRLLGTAVLALSVGLAAAATGYVISEHVAIAAMLGLTATWSAGLLLS